MRLVIIESPYAGNVALNVEYARAAMLDCLARGEAPFASHLLYTQVLDDDEPDERYLGISAGLDWVERADASVVYVDLGVSGGMRQGIKRALAVGRAVYARGLFPSPRALCGEIFGDEEGRKAICLLETDHATFGGHPDHIGVKL